MTERPEPRHSGIQYRVLIPYLWAIVKQFARSIGHRPNAHLHAIEHCCNFFAARNHPLQIVFTVDVKRGDPSNDQASSGISSINSIVLPQ
jgi:hypothetical protein